MTSWRDSTSQQTQDDFDGLLNVVLPFAEQSLSRYGEFCPYGAVVTVEGESRMTAADTGEERPDSTALLQVLYESARSVSATLRAVAFVADVRVGSSDAIRIELEAPLGASIQVVLPYKRNVLTKRVTIGTMSVSSAPRHVWEV